MQDVEYRDVCVRRTKNPIEMDTHYSASPQTTGTLIPRFRDDTGYVHEGVGLDALLHWADVFVVVTAHKAIDWDHFYAGAPLVVDTVNSSRGHAVHERQVLRLGAGWSGDA